MSFLSNFYSIKKLKVKQEAFLTIVLLPEQDQVPKSTTITTQLLWNLRNLQVNPKNLKKTRNRKRRRKRKLLKVRIYIQCHFLIGISDDGFLTKLVNWIGNSSSSYKSPVAKEVAQVLSMRVSYTNNPTFYFHFIEIFNNFDNNNKYVFLFISNTIICY